MIAEIRNKLDKYLNNLKIKKKLFLLYFYCVMLPLVLTDAVILGITIRDEYDAKQEMLRNAVSSVMYNLNSAVENAVTISKNIYFNKYINEFLNTEFASNLDYYNRYQELLKDSLFDSSLGTSNAIITMYGDNEGIVNGGRFWRLESIREEEWYKTFRDSGQSMQMYFYYDDSKLTQPEAVRKASFVRKLDYYKRDKYSKLLKIDLDCVAINQAMIMGNYDSDIYVCGEDGRILFSNTGNAGLTQDYAYITGI